MGRLQSPSALRQCRFGDRCIAIELEARKRHPHRRPFRCADCPIPRRNRLASTRPFMHFMRAMRHWAIAIFISVPALAAEPKAPADLGIELMPIAAGAFTMGSPGDEPWRNANGTTGEGPQTKVTISRPFWLAKTETTRAQFEALMGATPDPWGKTVADEWKAKGADFGKFPIVNVTWDQALEFCKKLTDRERAAGRLPAGFVYSLPTEAQWEYACRAGTTTRNFGGNTDDATAIAWYVKTTGPFNRVTMPRIQPVAGKKPNAWGLHDLLGNAREWCLDWIGPYPGGDVTDPRGPEKPVKPNLAFRVQRGGAWIDPKSKLRCAWRGWAAPSFGSQKRFQEGTVGFRVAVVAE
jgi:formylglycine-generating enzyme required for sulfatase activity